MLKDNLRMLASKHFSLPEIWGLQPPHTTEEEVGPGGEHIISFYKETLVLRASHSEQDFWCHTRQHCFVT